MPKHLGGAIGPRLTPHRSAPLQRGLHLDGRGCRYLPQPARFFRHDRGQTGPRSGGLRSAAVAAAICMQAAPTGIGNAYTATATICAAVERKSAVRRNDPPYQVPGMPLCSQAASRSDDSPGMVGGRHRNCRSQLSNIEGTASNAETLLTTVTGLKQAAATQT